MTAAGVRVAPLVAVLALSGCGHPACTAIGASSLISVAFDSVRAAHPGQRLTARACVAGTCHQRPVGRIARAFGFRVSDGDPVRTTLTVTSGAGVVIFSGRVVVRPHEHQPNGPSCPPTAWSAEVRTFGKQLRQAA